jgi:hypothetical protein
MAVGACKTFVIGGIKFIPVDHPVVAHHSGNFSITYLIEISIFRTAMTPETFLILIEELRFKRLFISCCVLSGHTNLRHEHQVYN